MDKLIIGGGRPLSGDVRISGARMLHCRFSRPCWPAADGHQQHPAPARHPRPPWAAGPHMGVGLTVDEKMRVEVDAGRLDNPFRATNWVKTMRASILPGPCWRAMGNRVAAGAAARSARAPSTCTSRACGRWVPRSRSRGIYQGARQRLKGAHWCSTNAVTVTENLMMAATLAKASPCWRTRARPGWSASPTASTQWARASAVAPAPRRHDRGSVHGTQIQGCC